MSLAYRNRIAQLLAQDETLGMTDTEKKDIYGWCKISDDVVRDMIKKLNLKQDIDTFIENASDEDIKDIHARVMQIYRKRKTAKYLRENGRAEQADELDAQANQQEQELQQEVGV